MRQRERGVEPAKARTRTLLLAVAVVALVATVTGVAVYRDRIAPYRAPVVVVDDVAVPMRYFLTRVRLSGLEPMTMLDTIMKEQIITQVAPEPPYNLRVTDAEIDQFLGEVATGMGDALANNEYREWYRQQLNQSGLSEAEFRDIARVTLLTRRLSEYLARRVPTVAEQVHLHVISVDDLEAARRAKERLDAGEGFPALARELSTDEESRKNGGDLGWLPRLALPADFARIVFDELETAKASEPLGLGEATFSVVMVSERTAAREIDPATRQKIEVQALDSWMSEESARHAVEFRGFKGGYDAETDAWVRWQVQRGATTGGRQ